MSATRRGPQHLAAMSYRRRARRTARAHLRRSCDRGCRDSRTRSRTAPGGRCRAHVWPLSAETSSCPSVALTAYTRRPAVRRLWKLADEPDELAGPDGQTGAPQDTDAPAVPGRPTAEGLVDVDDAQHGRCVSCRLIRSERRDGGHAGCASWRGSARAGFGSRKRFSATALTATMMLEPAIEMAATSGRRTRPSGSKTPAAIGSASEL